METTDLMMDVGFLQSFSPLKLLLTVDCKSPSNQQQSDRTCVFVCVCVILDETLTLERQNMFNLNVQNIFHHKVNFHGEKMTELLFTLLLDIVEK